MNFIKDIVLIVVLLLIAGTLYGGAQRMKVQKVEVEAQATDFAEVGTITVNNPGQGQGVMYLVYEKPGAPALSKELQLDELSVCASGSGAAPCMAMSVTFDAAFHGRRAIVEGILLGENALLVRRLQRLEAGQLPLVPSAGNRYISWTEARTLLEGCNVDMVAQAHSLTVTLTLKDEREFQTVEPAIDEVFRVIEELPAGCGPSSVATE